VTLAVARRLKAAVEGRLGIRVLLTREGDQAVGLDERAANASWRSSVKGAQVFFLTSEGFGEALRRLQTTAQQLPALGGGMREIEMVPWEMAQTRYIAQSGALANLVEEQLRQHVPISPRPVQQAPLRVLVGANMPAVLVEMGFLTNAGQEQRLSSDEFQANLAGAIADAIVRYRGGTARLEPRSPDHADADERTSEASEPRERSGELRGPRERAWRGVRRGEAPRLRQ
jgi:N-acetylmuramoyl-L-alanine amidase